MGSSAGMLTIRAAQRQMHKSLLLEGRDIVVDIDSSGETVYGRQEESAVGFNPHHHGTHLPVRQGKLAYANE